MEKYDVVIIGAGSSGLNCARVLAGSDKSVLVLEKNKSIIPPASVNIGVNNDSIEYLGLPKNFPMRKFKTVEIEAAKVKARIKSSRGIVSSVDRRDWISFMVKKIVNAKNISIRPGVTVKKILGSKNQIILDDGTVVNYKYLVGAGGSSSLVRSYLKIWPKKFNVAVQYILPRDDKYQDIKVFLDPSYFGSGYAWIFPHQDSISIGCGSNPKFFPVDKLMRNFEEWLADKKIDVSGGRYEPYFLNYDYQGYKFGNIFLVGDAAGLDSVFSGYGVSQAIVSGSIVAKSILNPSYKSVRMKKITDRIATSQFYFDIFYKLGSSRARALKLAAIIFGDKKYKDKYLEILSIDD